MKFTHAIAAFALLAIAVSSADAACRAKRGARSCSPPEHSAIVSQAQVCDAAGVCTTPALGTWQSSATACTTAGPNVDRRRFLGRLFQGRRSGRGGCS